MSSHHRHHKSHRDKGHKSRIIASKIADGVTLHFSADRVIGNGSFGVVFEAKVAETGEIVAIKKVLQDKRFKNRELHMMRQLDHCNVCKLKHCFYTSGSKADELYLNLVLEYVPETVYNITRHYLKAKQLPPIICVKLYMYQLMRSLAYISAMSICHRDIKPQNLLVDPSNHVLKLCDFGSSKTLVAGEPNVAYICSRYYRAPELIFGATSYTTSVDVWSAGCVAAELLLGTPLFPGESGVDQLVEIIKVLGTPTREDIRSMNCSYADFKFPQIKSHPWEKVLRRAPPEAIDFVSQLLVYTPSQRLTPLEAMAHPLFDELRYPGARLPNGKPLPPLFNFSQSEMQRHPELFKTLIPEHARTKENWPPPSPSASQAHGRHAPFAAAASPSVSLPTPTRPTKERRVGSVKRSGSERSSKRSGGSNSSSYHRVPTKAAAGSGSGSGTSGSGAVDGKPREGGSSSAALPPVNSTSRSHVALPAVPPPSVRHGTARTTATAATDRSDRTDRVPTIASRSGRGASYHASHYREPSSSSSHRDRYTLPRPRGEGSSRRY